MCPERADGGWGARALLRGLVHDVLIVHVECTSVDAQRLKARHEKRVEGLLLELIVYNIIIIMPHDIVSSSITRYGQARGVLYQRLCEYSRTAAA